MIYLRRVSEAFNKFWEILVDYFEVCLRLSPSMPELRAGTLMSNPRWSNSDPTSIRIMYLKPSQWEGEGGNSYRRSVSDQSAACNAVATMAGTVGSTLTKCAIGGLVFYGAIIVVLIKMIAGVGAGTGATATGVGAPVGLLAILASIGIGSARLAYSSLQP